MLEKVICKTYNVQFWWDCTINGQKSMHPDVKTTKDSYKMSAGHLPSLQTTLNVIYDLAVRKSD
jgi:hypothetical protein